MEDIVNGNEIFHGENKLEKTAFAANIGNKKKKRRKKTIKLIEYIYIYST